MYRSNMFDQTTATSLVKATQHIWSNIFDATFFRQCLMPHVWSNDAANLMQHVATYIWYQKFCIKHIASNMLHHTTCAGLIKDFVSNMFYQICCIYLDRANFRTLLGVFVVGNAFRQKHWNAELSLICQHNTYL